MATAMAALALAACGNTSTTKESSQPYEAATTKIKEGHFKEALKTLNAADSSSQKSQVLASDLQNYLAAKTAYNKGNYDQALTSLSTSKSGNESMQTAYQNIRVKIAKATSGDQDTTSEASSSSESQATSSSSTKKASVAKSTSAKSSSATKQSTTTSTSSSSTAANVSAAKATSESVIQKFATKLGFNKPGYGIIPVSQTGDVYRFEVRQSNDDNTVANLIGIYEYNEKTGEVTQVA